MLPFHPKRALLSVSDKYGLIELATILHKQHVELVATGNTAALLQQANLPVTDVSTCTHFPELLNGRVKTLHPAIHAGLLADTHQDKQQLEQQYSIQTFDLLIVNLYPFEQVTNNHNCDFQHAIENIDIGGTAMIRAGAKNHTNVLVIVTPTDYEQLAYCVSKQSLPIGWRFKLAQKAFAHTAAYDAAISNYLSKLDAEKKLLEFPSVLTCQFHKQYELRYGENPHQKAIFYKDNTSNNNLPSNSLATASIIQGKLLSYNNLLDADAAFNCIKSFASDLPTCVIVKHGNPCGIATSDQQLQSYLRAYQSDPVSSYGGILAFNRHLQAETVQAILDNQFAEIIIAPSISDNAKEILSNKPNIRVLIIGELSKHKQSSLDIRRIDGGILVQEYDALLLTNKDFTVVTTKSPSLQEKQDLLFAWKAVTHVKSNAIVLAKDSATIGIGAGQTSRVMSSRIALWQAEFSGFSSQGAVMASDAFIPFSDSLEMAARVGISAVIQPGGSIRDSEITTIANDLGISMVFTAIRHFKH